MATSASSVNKLPLKQIVSFFITIFANDCLRDKLIKWLILDYKSQTFLLEMSSLFNKWRKPYNFKRFVTSRVMNFVVINDNINTYEAIIIQLLFFGHACFWISAIKKRVFSSMQKNSCYNAAGSYLFKVNNKNTRNLFSKLTIKTPERRHWCYYGQL